MTRFIYAIVWLLVLAAIGYSMELVNMAATGALAPITDALGGDSP